MSWYEAVSHMACEVPSYSPGRESGILLACVVTDVRGHNSKQTLEVSLDLNTKWNGHLKAPSRQDRQRQVELMSLGQETQLGVLGTPRLTLYTYGCTNETKRTLPHTHNAVHKLRYNR